MLWQAKSTGDQVAQENPANAAASLAPCWHTHSAVLGALQNPDVIILACEH